MLTCAIMVTCEGTALANIVRNTAALLTVVRYVKHISVAGLPDLIFDRTALMSSIERLHRQHRVRVPPYFTERRTLASLPAPIMMCFGCLRVCKQTQHRRRYRTHTFKRDADVFLSLIQIVGKVPSTRGGWLTWREAVRALCSAVECARNVERSLSNATFNGGSSPVVGKAGQLSFQVAVGPDQVAHDQFVPYLIKYLVGHGLILALTKTSREAANTSMELCMDPALKLVELLVEAGNPILKTNTVVSTRTATPPPPPPPPLLPAAALSHESIAIGADHAAAAAAAAVQDFATAAAVVVAGAAAPASPLSNTTAPLVTPRLSPEVAAATTTTTITTTTPTRTTIQPQTTAAPLPKTTIITADVIQAPPPSLKAFNDICEMLPLPEGYMPEYAKDGNIYMQFIRDTGLGETMSVAYMARYAFPNYPSSSPTTPFHHSTSF